MGMHGNDDKGRIATRSIRHKLKVAFYLMTLIPLLVCVYLVSNYILPSVGLKLDVTASVVLSFVISIGGLFVIKEIFDRIITTCNQASLIAKGEVTQALAVSEEDEMGNLSRALNQLTDRVRRDMEELKGYSEHTSRLNLEIQKHVTMLSNVLQISYLISQRAQVEDLLKLVVEKSQLMSESEMAFLFMKEEGADEFRLKAATGAQGKVPLASVIHTRDELFCMLARVTRPVVYDAANAQPPNLTQDINDKFGLRNVAVTAIYLKGKIAGMLGVGNNTDNFTYGKSDIRLLDVFGKLVAIAVENDLLARRLEKLEVKDFLTGLYNEEFIRGRLQEEIRRAALYQRPCSYVLLSIQRFDLFRQKFGTLPAETTLKQVAEIIRNSVTEVDRVARSEDCVFAIVLPEKNKRQAQRIAEEVRKKIESTFSQEQELERRLKVAVGVSENPIDGVTAGELIAKAQESLSVAV